MIKKFCSILFLHFKGGQQHRENCYVIEGIHRIKLPAFRKTNLTEFVTMSLVRTYCAKHVI